MFFGSKIKRTLIGNGATPDEEWEELAPIVERRPCLHGAEKIWVEKRLDRNIIMAKMAVAVTEAEQKNKEEKMKSNEEISKSKIEELKKDSDGNYLYPKKGKKDDKGKLDFSLLPMQLLEGVIKVLMEGAKKYGAFDWTSVENGEHRFKNAAKRHLLDMEKGELINEKDFNLPHIDHFLTDVIFYSYFYKLRKGLMKPMSVKEFLEIRGIKEE